MWNTRRLKEASSGCMLLFLRESKPGGECATAQVGKKTAVGPGWLAI